MPEDDSADLAAAVRTLAVAVVAGLVGVALLYATSGGPARLGLLFVVGGALLAGASYVEAGS